MQYEQTLAEHERMIYHLIHKYQIRDQEGEFYQEGLIALWHALKSHDPAKSKFSTYAYSCISRRFINKMKKENREREQIQRLQEQASIDDLITEDEHVFDPVFFQAIQRTLSPKQWWWFIGYICRDQSVKEIAAQHQVTENAVKNWGKHARPKLQQLVQTQWSDGGALS
ncbi:sigma-70 family RNA polymerase sigma factor [Gracilibacillus alcaliphilus]|uniref:sigma-70 family RNA polymerase sigma factor n=1 Tax=Gracilibacillus alcaliphilus TaxID=1401441 RepID=UPI001956C904|nr:sigma-70 family RNA polymerase sigma factor [Gracilibacillus alcaliphilus]MBM7677686.1 RNA polymerase sigma factor (sigma-70 family) [Gracilibacillus alcaliphilus]